MALTPHVQWTTPAPLWPIVANGVDIEPGTRFEQPVLLRFSNDDFMEELLALLSDEPGRLMNFQAKPEVWSGIPEADSPLKLFQAAHQRYYLVATNLVCRSPGLPDWLLSFKFGYETSFFVRRLKGTQAGLGPPTDNNLEFFDEYAFVLEGENSVWERIGPATDLITKDLNDNEQQYPLFGLGYQESKDLRRRLLAGLIPVGKYEVFLGAQLVDASDTSDVQIAGEGGEVQLDATNDPRLALLHKQVIVPWRSLITLRANAANTRGEGTLLEQFEAAGLEPTGEDLDDYLEALAERTYQNDQLDRQIQMSSWYILLDLADFLADYGVLEAVGDELPTELTELENAINEIVLHREQLEGALLAFVRDVGPTLSHSGQDAFYYDEADEQVKARDDWPAANPFGDDTFDSLVKEPQDGTHLVSIVADALQGIEIQEGTPPLPLAAQQAALAAQQAAATGESDLGREAWFAIRCVFNRPQCVGQARLVVSEATKPFQMASFFDPEAPSRPVRISLPLDTSPAGLRKFSKNTAFVLSDILACQLEQVQGITLGDLVLSVLPWPFHKPLPEPDDSACADVSDGLVCSLSIPIVTLCALILLIIIVNVLDYFFRWVPFLMTCFKLPGLKGKESA